MKTTKGIMTYSVNSQKIDIIFDIEKTTTNKDLSITPLISDERLTVDIEPKKLIVINSIELVEPTKYKIGDRVYLSGFQSWTQSDEFKLNAKISKLNKITFNRYKHTGDYTYYDYTGREGILHSWTYTYLRNGNSQNIRFYGSVLEDSGYTIFEHNTKENKLRISKNFDKIEIYSKYRALDIVTIDGDENNVFNQYFGVMKLHSKQIPLVSTWTNKYCENKQEVGIIENLNIIHKKNLPIDMIVIESSEVTNRNKLNKDDNYQDRLKNIARKIKSKGYKAGLRISPFVCKKNSELLPKHPEWITRNEKGSPVIIGHNTGWGGDIYAIDFYNKEARDYIRKTIETALFEWNYDAIDLDLLYAVAINPRKSKTRSQVMFEAMDFLRRIFKNKTMIASAVPIAPCFGVADYYYTSKSDLVWDKNKITNMINQREAGSVLGSLQNTISRRHMDGHAFGNVSGISILSDNRKKLGNDQLFTMFLINNIFGSMVITSGDMTEIGQHAIDLYQSMYPMVKKNSLLVENDNDVYKIRFKVNDREYLTLCNLKKLDRTVKIDDGSYFSNTDYSIINSPYDLNLRPYQSVCLYKIDHNKRVELLGGKGHIFAGCDVSNFKLNLLGNAVLEFYENNHNKQPIYIKIPAEKNTLKVNSSQYKAKEIGKLNIIKLLRK